MTDRPVVSLQSVYKQFDGIHALKNVSLAIEKAEIHALVGENGAGKSTLGKIVGGALRPTSGQVFVDGGRAVKYASPGDALADGIALISQEVTLVPYLTVLDNVFLGIETASFGFMSRRATRRRFEELTARSGFRLDPHTMVGSLRIADQKQVEILRAIARNARLIVMDEPTVCMSPGEVQKLFTLVRGMRGAGTAILYVSHFLEEVLAIADRVTVLRNGELIKTSPVRDETTDRLVEAMLGTAVTEGFPEKMYPPSDAPGVLEVVGLSRPGAFTRVSFNIRAGEILGLAGLVGSGRTEIARAIFAADRLAEGKVRLNGQDVRVRSPRDAIRAGIVLLPESRKLQGLIMKLSAGSNVTLPHLSQVANGPLVHLQVEDRLTRALMAELDVRPPDPMRPAAEYSGGNQQKILFAKWLFRKPYVFIADEPAAGVDVGAKRAIYRLIHSLAREGVAVLLISSVLCEVVGLAHRVLALHRGQVVAEFGGSDVNEERVMHAIFAQDQGGAGTCGLDSPSHP